MRGEKTAVPAVRQQRRPPTEPPKQKPTMPRISQPLLFTNGTTASSSSLSTTSPAGRCPPCRGDSWRKKSGTNTLKPAFARPGPAPHPVLCRQRWGQPACGQLRVARRGNSSSGRTGACVWRGLGAAFRRAVERSALGQRACRRFHAGRPHSQSRKRRTDYSGQRSLSAARHDSRSALCFMLTSQPGVVRPMIS